MQDFIGSVRRSLVFKPYTSDDGPGLGGFVEKIGSSIRNSRIGIFSKPSLQGLPPIADVARRDEAPVIRWRKGELIGCGAFGRVYMGMNLDSGELIAVKQVSIAVNNASKEKAQAHIRELEEEVNLLKNLSHPNIVRYLGTGREDESLNILLEFVPGGSISSLLGKFGSFPESVIRMYTKQLLLGLEYLHKNGIMHRDIKGANILVDNKGCIKLADFGASKKVVELATMTGAKSMKGTPYWMAPEVILQTGHNFSADIWSVGCTVIEMATGKPPWSQQYQEVAALFHIGTTKSHPPIPEHLSAEAVDFLLKCLQKEPSSRPSASELLRHPFVMGKCQNTGSILASVLENPGKQMSTLDMDCKNSMSYRPKKDVDSSVRCSTVCTKKFSEGLERWGSRDSDDDLCCMDDDDLMVGIPTKPATTLLCDDMNKSFNPMSEPNDDWPCNFDENPELKRSRTNLSPSPSHEKAAERTLPSGNGDGEFTFPGGPSVTEDDDEVTESKIRAFLDEKALDLKKLQTPLYEKFFNSLNAADSPNAVGIENKENLRNNSNLPPKSPKSKSPKRGPSRRLSAAIGIAYNTISRSPSRRTSNLGAVSDRTVTDVQSLKLSELKESVDSPQKLIISPSFSERQRIWEEELYEELERKREMMRQAGVAKTPSPNRVFNRQKSISKSTFAGK